MIRPEVKEALTAAIVACDAELEEREPNEILTGYVVVACWTKIDDGEPGVDSTQITSIQGPNPMAIHQAVGLLRVGERYALDAAAEGDR